MESYIESLLVHNAFYIYTILFVLIFLENTVPFVPGDAVLIFSAYLSGREALYPLPAFLITVTGSLTGFLFVFLLSRSWRQNIYQKLPFRIRPEKIRKYRGLFQRHENWALVVGRVIPGSRLFLSATAGFMNISITKATILTLFGILTWNSIIFRSGMLLGENWEMIKKTLSQYSSAVNLVIILLVIIIIGWKWILPKLRKHYG